MNSISIQCCTLFYILIKIMNLIWMFSAGEAWWEHNNLNCVRHDAISFLMCDNWWSNNGHWWVSVCIALLVPLNEAKVSLSMVQNVNIKSHLLSEARDTENDNYVSSSKRPYNYNRKVWIHKWHFSAGMKNIYLLQWHIVYVNKHIHKGSLKSSQITCLIKTMHEFQTDVLHSH